MRRIEYLLIVTVLMLPCVIRAQNIKTGLEVLKESNFEILKGKRVGQ